MFFALKFVWILESPRTTNKKIYAIESHIAQRILTLWLVTGLGEAFSVERKVFYDTALEQQQNNTSKNN